jgi:hypothetical protein
MESSLEVEGELDGLRVWAKGREAQPNSKAR